MGEFGGELTHAGEDVGGGFGGGVGVEFAVGLDGGGVGGEGGGFVVGGGKGVAEEGLGFDGVGG